MLLEPFTTRALLLDVSRGVMPTLDQFKALIDRLVAANMTAICLYLEPQSWSSEAWPALDPDYPTLTPNTLRAIDAYCTARGLTIIPAIQSLGHMTALVSHPDWSHLALSDERWSIKPCPETYDLLGRLYADILACYSGPYVHACMDEPTDLLPSDRYSHAVAMGYLPPLDYQPRTMRGTVAAIDLYAHHLHAMQAIAYQHGKKMILWDDILAQHPALVCDVPRSSIVASWFYAPLSDDDAIHLSALHSIGIETWVTASTHGHDTRLSVAERCQRARANIDAQVLLGRTHGSTGFCLAAWGDGGYNPLDAALDAALAHLITAHVPIPPLDRQTRYAVYSALQRVYGRAVRISESTMGMEMAERKTLHADKRRYVPMDALAAITGTCQEAHRL